MYLHYLYEAKLNDKGLKYVRGDVIKEYNKRDKSIFYTHVNVVTETTEFGEVTGIVFIDESNTKAKVEFTEVRDVTPFADTSPKKETVSRTAIFALYDDGWRGQLTNNSW